MNEKIKATMDRRKKIVDDAILEMIDRESSLHNKLAESMRYSLSTGGKRLRPILLMAAADSLGIDGEKFLTTAIAIEMIHTYSLIHDDLPAMDDDDYRRGQLTNHKIYGDALAILAGDALQSLAFEILTREKNAADSQKLSVIKEISHAIGMCGMVGGQAIDLDAEGKHIDLKTLKKMHLGKTGALFTAAIRSGAILANANPDQLESLTTYAKNYGLAFQITDDILDITGDESELGKPIGSDLRNLKSTYVTLTSLSEAKKLAKESSDNAIKSLENFGSEADFLRELAIFQVERKK
ncbi:MAG: polyprenyl synthetase family protein [Selenomonadaceae bacterium]|nr:polyprenyl synthetase family protein [Selenomonadaceae bacterium]